MKLPGQRQYPKSISFGDETYKIEWVKRFADKATLGECDGSDRVIRIRRGLTREDMFRTFLHELIHLAEFEVPIDLKHKTVYLLEEAIFKFIIQNL